MGTEKVDFSRTADNQLVMNVIQKRFIDRIFGKLTVISFVEYRNSEILKSGKIKKAGYYLCQCECGNLKTIKGDNLKNGDTKSCGCLQPEITIRRNIKRRRSTSHFPSLYSAYKGNAKFRLINFELSIEHFKEITSKNCYYCGVPPLQLASKHKTFKERYPKYLYKEEYFYNGIDRINSSKGYSLDNVRPCCGICNKAKRDLSDSEFQIWINRLIDFQIKGR